MSWGFLYPSLSPVASIQVSVSNGFRNMSGTHFFAAVEVGDGAGHFQNTVVGAGGEFQTFHAHAQQLQRLCIGFCVVVYHALGHLGVAVHATDVFEALFLHAAGFDDTLADG